MIVFFLLIFFFFFFLMIRRPPRSTLFPTRRSSDHPENDCADAGKRQPPFPRPRPPWASEGLRHVTSSLSLGVMILVFQHHDKPTSRASAALAVETERTARCGHRTRRSSIGQTFRSPMVPFVLRLRLQRRRKDPNVSGADGPPDLEAAWVVVVDVLC